MQQFFYDQQVKRYLEQFMRLFAGLSVRMGVDKDGTEIFQRVPIRYGDTSRMVAHILSNNSENALNTVPMISVHIQAFNMNASRRNNPTYQDKVQVYEKRYNKDLGVYESNTGDTYTVERYMPVPYDLEVVCDICTSNTDQKMQILEQLAVAFNPGVNIRSSGNVFDWSALTYVEMTNVQWSNRSLPVGNDEQLDFATVTFLMPIWINPPAKVKRQVLIYNIIGSIQTATSGYDLDTFPETFTTDEPTTKSYLVLTFENYKIDVEGDKVYLLDQVGRNVGADWLNEIKPYGELRPGVSQLRLRPSEAPNPGFKDDDIIGTIVYDEDPNRLHFTIDRNTLPADTLNMVNGIIDPTKHAPGQGSLPHAAIGQRYLLIAETPDIPEWNNVGAKANDIVQFNGTNWYIAFNSATEQELNIVTNANTMLKYKWVDGEWIDVYQGIYKEGYWRLYL